MNNVLFFTKESIIKAIETIENNPNLRIGRESHDYDLVYNNNFYPPILVLSEANKYLGGESLTIRDFNNSTYIAFKNYTKFGFEIRKKSIDFFPELNKFIQQAKTLNLNTTEYVKKLLQLDIKVSFGKGNQARIPWIAFLGYGNTVQKGIYPVFLFYKDLNKLILAYGVSETHKPDINWNIPNLQTIQTYFIQNKLGEPDRYKNSYIYAVFDLNVDLKKEEINSNLQSLIAVYHELFRLKETDTSNQQEQKPMNTLLNQKVSISTTFSNDLQSANLSFTKELVTRFVSSLITKPFVILTGLSGSGKTKLAHAFAKWLCPNENQYCVIPVGADWTNREPLLGFPNALQSKEYIKPDNAVLDIIIAANNDTNNPYFLILDEMNLSHVERYFADFLSVMETKGSILLHSGDENWNGVPPNLSFPRNLYIIGTVNIDETTYMFSPKVLDRANVIEFNVSNNDMENYLSKLKTPNLDSLVGKGAYLAAGFVSLSKDDSLTPNQPSEITVVLMKFFTELKKVNAEFGFRSASEIFRFASVLNKSENSDWNVNSILDAAIMQKLLPKVHGSRRKLEPILKTLGSLCIAKEAEIDEYLNSKESAFKADSTKIKYPISLDKICRMYNNLLSNGFTSFAEA